VQKRIDAALGEVNNSPVADSSKSSNAPSGIVPPGTSKLGSAASRLPARDGAPKSTADGSPGQGDASTHRGDPKVTQPGRSFGQNRPAPDADSLLGLGVPGGGDAPNAADIQPANEQWVNGFVQSAKEAMGAGFGQRNTLGQNKLSADELKKLKELYEQSERWLKNERLKKRKFANKSRKPAERLDQMLIEGVQDALKDDDAKGDGAESIFTQLLNGALDTALNQAEEDAQRKIDRKSEHLNGNQPFNSDDDWSRSGQADRIGEAADQGFGSSFLNKTHQPSTRRQQASASSGESESVVQQAVDVARSLAEYNYNGWHLLYGLAIGLILIGLVAMLLKISAPSDKRLVKQKELQRILESESMRHPKDVVDAVDLFLLSRFGAVASWWNAKHATEQLSRAQPDMLDQVDDVFRVYKSFRYQQHAQQSVSDADQRTVRSTLTELANQPFGKFLSTVADPSNDSKSTAGLAVESTFIDQAPAEGVDPEAGENEAVR